MELVEWKQTGKQSRSEDGLGPDKDFSDVFEVFMVVDDVSEEGSMPESILGLGDFGKGPELFLISVRLKQSLRLSLRTNWMIPLIKLPTLM